MALTMDTMASIFVLVSLFLQASEKNSVSDHAPVTLQRDLTDEHRTLFKISEETREQRIY